MKNKKKSKKKESECAHNPHYCMIRPDPDDQHDDDTVSTSSS